MNRNQLIEKAKKIKANGNMLGVRVTIPGQQTTELIINDNDSIDNKVEYYCKAYDENLVHCMNDRIRIVEILEVTMIRAKKQAEQGDLLCAK